MRRGSLLWLKPCFILILSHQPWLHPRILEFRTSNVMQPRYCILMALIARSLSPKSIREAIDYPWQGGPIAWLELIVGTSLAVIVSFGLSRLVHCIFDLDSY